MRIKRFIAPDMRTALRMVRDEQGPDAVILSNRPCAEGIEVVAATDYDEALVQQALRAAVPGMAELAVEAAPVAAPRAAPIAVAAPAARAAEPSRAESMIAALSATPARDSLAARARAMFRIGDAATALDDAAVDQLVAVARGETVTATARQKAEAAGLVRAAREPAPPVAVEAPQAVADSAPTASPGDDFRAILARLTAEHAEETAELRALLDGAPAAPTPVADAVALSTPAAPPAQALPAATLATLAPANDASVEPAAPPAPVLDAPRPVLHAVATPAEDPALIAMRAELAMMRELIERQMDQYAIERLRGSAGRAAAFDALVGYGCDEGLAQSIASRLDAGLAPGAIREPMCAELARMIVCNRAEPIDDGGVIALVGPTGAGKTTTVAKLAARFAAKHRARDVALVTTDTERAGAREQLHAHGRRLGITVCEAQGPEGLSETLAQLADYPLVLVDTAGYAARDRALLGQILWLRTARRMRSLLVLPANANPHDLSEIIRRYRPASPEGVVLTKTDETGRLGAALSVLAKQDLSLAYTCGGQNVPTDLDVADPARLVQALETLRRAADNPLHVEDRNAVA